MKICPKCQRTWPSGGRFCPMDGSPLEEVKARPSDSGKATVVLPTAPATPVAKATKSVPAVKVAPVPAPKPAVDAKAPAEARPAVRATQGMKARKTVATPAVKVPAEPRPKKGEFSETKWFMAGDLVKDDEIGPEIFPAQQLEPRYRKTKELPADVRKKFSLAKDDDVVKKG